LYVAQRFEKEVRTFIRDSKIETVALFERAVKEVMYAMDNSAAAAETDLSDDTVVFDKGRRIFFSTIFKSKGLGSNHVWWVTDDKRNPGNEDLPVEHLRPHMRNMYSVAITRSKEKLTLLGPPSCKFE
jgi:superfamily I DNA/RNA helicase